MICQLSCNSQPEYVDQWTIHSPGGETSCAFGSSFQYFSRNSDHEKLLVYFDGGGACWNGQLCDTTSKPTPYFYKIRNKYPLNSGIFNLDHPDNPFADYSMILIPSCCGDVFLGNNLLTYHYTDNINKRKSVTVYHKGYKNGMSALQWTFQHIAEPKIVVVAGSSAGGVSVPFYASIMARHYQKSRVIGIGDGAGAYGRDEMSDIDFKKWNSYQVLNDYTAFKNLDSGKIGIEDLYLSAANQKLKNLKLYQVDQAYDRAQEYYLSLSGIQNPDVYKSIKENRDEIKTKYPDFRSFTIGGTEHTILQNDRFYFNQTNGVLFLDWINNILKGNKVSNIDCTNCTKPGIRFSKTDLKIIRAMKELLSDSAYWDSHDNFQQDKRCTQNSKKYSLRCALHIAIQKEQGNMSEYPVAKALQFAASDKMADKTGRRDPILVQFNNANGRKFQDILNIMEQVEKTVQLQLQIFR